MHKFVRWNLRQNLRQKTSFVVIPTAQNRFIGLKTSFFLITPKPKFWRWRYQFYRIESWKRRRHFRNWSLRNQTATKYSNCGLTFEIAHFVKKLFFTLFDDEEFETFSKVKTSNLIFITLWNVPRGHSNNMWHFSRTFKTPPRPPPPTSLVLPHQFKTGK